SHEGAKRSTLTKKPNLMFSSWPSTFFVAIVANRLGDQSMKRVRWNLTIGLLAIGLATVVAVKVTAQARGGAAPAPANQSAAPASPAPNPNATGVVEFQPIDGMLTRRLRFEAGARTNWHTHTHRQMIWA